MSSLFFSKPDPTEATTRTACSKLSNNAALVVNELAREPAQGLLHVAVSWFVKNWREERYTVYGMQTKLTI